MLLLAVPLVPYVLSQSPTAGAFGITAGVAVAAGAWITWMIHLHPRWTEHRWLMLVYFIGLLAFIAMLTIRSPWFAFFTWLGFIHAFRFLPGAWRWVGCAAVGIFFGMAQSGDSTGRPYRRWPSGCSWRASTWCSWEPSPSWA